MSKHPVSSLRRLLVSLVALFALALVPAVALAGAATDLVKAKQTALFDLLKKGGADSDKKIGVIFDELLDYQALAQASLGSEWAGRSDAEKKEFSDLLKQLVKKAYEKNLKKTLDYDVDYVSEEAKDGATFVKTKAKKKGDAKADPVRIDYKLVQTGGKWKVQDIVTEEVSLVGSWRSQFTKIVKKDGFPALVQKMKDKLAKNDV